MNRIFFFFLIVALAACKNDTPVGNGANTTTQNLPSKSATGSFTAPMASGDSPLASLLATEYWVFEYWIGNDNNQVTNVFNRGRWFKFNLDGTYIHGHWTEQTGHGSWFLQKEDGHDILHLDSIIDAEDGRWDVQGVNRSQDTMTWVGESQTAVEGVITKVINLTSMPTKAQFGLE
ncbi:MAG TPA: hypothetical protein PKA00_19350 [Saprospiraceae bacterium]|nr:hypothetical protein [Saprospiraceae bacterium]HMQ85075.1 hypothetical protein [Saprospiraceae bacterium]